MHLHLLPLLSLPLLTLTHTLTLTIPPSHPLLPPSTRAHLTTHGHTLTTPLTRANTFVFRNLTGPEEYNLDIYCRDWDFEGGVVVVPAEESQEEVQGRGEGKVKGGVEVYRRNRRTGAKGGRILKNEDGGVEVRVLRRREYYEERGGFSPMSMLKSPMILMGLVGLAVVFGMPYLMENMDPEFRKEFEEQQKKGVLGTGASGGNPLQSFDMAGWMAGQTSGQSSESGPVTSGRDKEEGNGGNAGGGRGKRRRG